MIGKKYKPKRVEKCFEQVIICLLFQVEIWILSLFPPCPIFPTPNSHQDLPAPPQLSLIHLRPSTPVAFRVKSKRSVIFKSLNNLYVTFSLVFFQPLMCTLCPRFSE